MVMKTAIVDTDQRDGESSFISSEVIFGPPGHWAINYPSCLPSTTPIILVGQGFQGSCFLPSFGLIS